MEFPYYDPFGNIATYVTNKINAFKGDKITPLFRIDSAETVNKTGYFVGQLFWRTTSNINNLYNSVDGVVQSPEVFKSNHLDIGKKYF